MLEINRIRIDGGTQSRVELNQETVSEYTEAYRAGALFPPVVVFFDGTDRWLADGFHRYFGAKAAGLEKIFEEVIPGTQRDAVLYSLKANATHGLKRSNADKRKAIETLLADAEWAAWSDLAIAKAAGVNDKTVAVVRRAHSGNSEVRNESATERTYTTKHGTEAVMKTSNIGKRVPAPAPREAVSRRESPAAAETSEAEDAEDHGADIDLVEELEAMNAENAKLRTLLEADDKAAEALRWLRAYEVAQRRSDEHLTTVNSRDKQIKFLARQLERCGKAVGELDQDKIAPAVEARIRAIREAV